MGHKVKCISVSEENEKLAEENKISWSEAARVGIAVLLSEKGISNYQNNLNEFRKLKKIVTEFTKEANI